MSKSSEEAPTQEGGAGRGAGGAGGQKDIYENRAGTKKIIRVVTVMAYVFSVSFAAILLSAYYVFLWEPPNPRTIQRHPLTGDDPQAEYLTDNLNSEILMTSEDEGSAITDYQNSIKNVAHIKENSDKYHAEKLLAPYPQSLLAYEDFVRLNYRNKLLSELEDSKKQKTTPSELETPPDVQTELLTTMLPIFVKTQSDIEIGHNSSSSDLSLGIMPTIESTRVTMEKNKLNDADADDGDDDKKKVIDLSRNNETKTSALLMEKLREFSRWQNDAKIPMKRSGRHDYDKNDDYGIKNSDLIIAETTIATTVTTSTEWDTSSITTTSTADDVESTTINQQELVEAYDYDSSPKIVGETFDNNVTIGNYGTTDAPTSQMQPMVIPELEKNYETISLVDDDDDQSTFSQDMENVDTTTTTSHVVKNYAEESARVVSENLKK